MARTQTRKPVSTHTFLGMPHAGKRCITVLVRLPEWRRLPHTMHVSYTNRTKTTPDNEWFFDHLQHLSNEQCCHKITTSTHPTNKSLVTLSHTVT
eukprot:1160931-Pelagomonas_calceolata.AAC.4